MSKHTFHYLNENSEVIEVNNNLQISKILYNKVEVEKMTAPVRCCKCGKVFDLASAKVVHRYQDCTQFITPCCQKPADDRVWKSIPDIESIRLIPDSKLIKNS